ncbi:hypothetical protein V2J09_015172 [Rumex salicifolius]
MARQESYDCGLNLKATELSLALPGSDDQEQPTTSFTCITSKKRNSRDDDTIPPPPTKTQIVGWPPVQSYRKNNIQTKKSDGSGLYVKVNMDGAPYLRKIDLRSCKGYGELLEMLENMFKVKIGRYSDKEGYGESDYTPSYEDKEGDWMLVGDVPWEMFVSSCKRLRIIKSCEAKGLCL